LRHVEDAKCGINQPEIEAAALCHAGGHGCWEYLVLPLEQDRPVPYIAPALTRAFDYLDMAWRLRFAGAGSLVVMPGTQAIAALELGCASREEFGDRIIALGDVLGAMRVSSSLFDPEPECDKWRSLKRLDGALKKNVADSATVARACDGIDILRAANDLRAGVAHGGYKARADSGKAERTLRIPFYPRTSWAETWNQLRARVAEALGLIAVALREP
jgi:hypothetical protein